MNYKAYKKSRDLAWNILINENITSLPIKVSALCRQMGIIVKYYIPDDENDGKCMIINNMPVIFVNKGNSIPRQRFTAAHELGHILLGHVGKYKLVNREPSSSDNPIEREANIFASRLLAPACVLWGCGARSADDIAKLCNISRQSAEYRMERMNILYKRDRFLISSLERQVYKQFYIYINNNHL